jgi:hypothetical protein
MHIHAIRAYSYIHAYLHITYIAVFLDHIRTYMIYIFIYEPTDPLARRGFADGDCPAASTGDPEAESQQELFSRLGRDALAPGGARSCCAGWAANRRAAHSSTFRRATRCPPHRPGWGQICAGWLRASAGTGQTRLGAPSPPVPSDDLFLSPTFVQTLTEE